ncbi:MAG: hypothetical protein LBE64_08475 [Acinetobacter pittii]|nr:hypothetical protein [Acinetobacter pittii]
MYTTSWAEIAQVAGAWLRDIHFPRFICLITVLNWSTKEGMSSKNDIFNSRGPFHDSIIKERKEKQVEAEQSKHTACNAMQCRKTSTQVHDVCIAIILVSVMIPRYLQKGRKWYRGSIHLGESKIANGQTPRVLCSMALGP